MKKKRIDNFYRPEYYTMLSSHKKNPVVILKRNKCFLTA